jgi:hypothetical protein
MEPDEQLTKYLRLSDERIAADHTTHARAPV